MIRVCDGGPRGRDGHLVGHRTGVVQAYRGLEVPGQPLLEGRGVHAALRDPARQVELVGEVVGIGPRVHRPEPGRRVGDVLCQQLDGGVSGLGVVIHGEQECALRRGIW